MNKIRNCLICFLIIPLFSHALIQVPMTKQSTDYSCGAAIVLSILGYYGQDENGDILETDLFKPLGTNSDYGTDYREMIKYFKSKGFDVCAHENMSICELKRLISLGHPVICLMQDWEDNITDYTNFWGIGHYVIAIGFDNEAIYVMDPWLLGNYGCIPIKQFESRWHQLTFDKIHLKNWGLTATKGKPCFKPNIFQYVP